LKSLKNIFQWKSLYFWW